MSSATAPTAAEDGQTQFVRPGKDSDGGGELSALALTPQALGSERLVKAPLRGLEGAEPWQPGARADAGPSRLPCGRGRRGTGPAAAPQQGEPKPQAGAKTDRTEALQPAEPG